MATTPPSQTDAGDDFEPLTPATPRLGPMFDPERQRIRRSARTPIRKHSQKEKQELHDSEIYTLLTPIQTPVKRKQKVETIGESSISAVPLSFSGRTPFPSNTRGVPGSGRNYQDLLTSPKNRRLKVYRESDDPFLSDNEDSSKPLHPHRPLPADTPGMWYTFRGKRIFRPFPKNISQEEINSIRPKKLFITEEANGHSTNATELNDESNDIEDEDTDVEEDKRDSFVRPPPPKFFRRVPK